MHSGLDYESCSIQIENAIAGLQQRNVPLDEHIRWQALLEAAKRVSSTTPEDCEAWRAALEREAPRLAAGAPEVLFTRWQATMTELVPGASAPDVTQINDQLTSMLGRPMSQSGRAASRGGVSQGVRAGSG